MAKKVKVRSRKASKASTKKAGGSRAGSAMSKVRAAYDAVIDGGGTVDEAKAAARKKGESVDLAPHTVRAWTSRYSRGVTGSTGGSAKKSAGKKKAKARVRTAKKAVKVRERVKAAAPAKRPAKKAARVRAERAESAEA